MTQSEESKKTILVFIDKMKKESYSEGYTAGVLEGISAYAWQKDSVMYVGTTGKTLKSALEEAQKGIYP